MEYMRCTTLGTSLLWLAILIYLACGERRNEGVILRPKDESEFLAKKKTFEANIFKFFLKGEPTCTCISKFWGAANQNTYRKFVWYDLQRLCLLEIFHVPNPPPPIPLGNFCLLTPHPLGISIDHPWRDMDIFWNHTIKLRLSQ